MRFIQFFIFYTKNLYIMLHISSRIILTTMILDNFIEESTPSDYLHRCFECGAYVPKHIVACWNCGEILDENIRNLMKNK